MFSEDRFPRDTPILILVEKFMTLFGPPETKEGWGSYIKTMQSRYFSLEDYKDPQPSKRRKITEPTLVSRSPTEKQCLLNQLINWIVEIPYDYEFHSDFDVLKNLTPSDYGLVPTDKGSWKHQLLWSLFEDGRFYNYHGTFLTPLFGSSSPGDVGPYDEDGESLNIPSAHTGTWLITVKSYKKQFEKMCKSIPERPKWMRRVTESLSEVKDATRKSRLRELINYVRTIYSVYSRIKKTDFREDFDVLCGKRDTLYYGLPVDALRGVKTTSKYFLYQVLVNSCPELAEAKPILKNNHADVLEALLPRLESHERDPEEVICDPIDENNIDLGQIFITAGEALSLECFKEGYIGEITGQNLCVTYSAVTLSHCFSKLKDQLVRSPFALIGSKNVGNNYYEGRFLVCDHPGGADIQLKRVMDFLVHEEEKKKNNEETNLLNKPQEELTQELELLNEAFARQYEFKTSQPIVFKTFDEKQTYTIRIIPEFPWHEVEYLSLVYGHSSENLVLRNFLSQESADKFRNEDYIPSRGQRFSKYSFFNIFCKMILVSCNLDWKSPKCVELFSYIPDFISEFYDPFLELSTRIQFLKNALSTLTAQCPHCGQIITSESTKRQRNRLTAHIRKCHLEVTACGCTGIKFKSYADKKRHIAFVHSVYICFNMNITSPIKCLFKSKLSKKGSDSILTKWTKCPPLQFVPSSQYEYQNYHLHSILETQSEWRTKMYSPGYISCPILILTT
ncbi:unnamed protein product [Lepeophtheirus salmonis]|uniref:(salmon louse) hypothetical protein n=1 Tax=Lepeophtheirus salmonis TaxID=72036 RepID=A0A7R8CJL2_LEPSM|nr:unnamed protein product [Lepeophtheirus salmonis]CAF2812289.1 unnamed protein product [Lepeophtheirus salmonis]